MRARQELDDQISRCERFAQNLEDSIELIELGEAEGDAEIVAEAEQALSELQKQTAKEQLQTLLSGEADPNDTYIEIHSGAGGTESQDWAQMLTRMYSRWAEAKGHRSK